MRKYIVKRLLLSVMILFCVSFIIYTLMRCLPGSFVETRAMQLSQGAGAKSYDEWMEQLNASYGLDKPIVLGFVTWAGDALKGNFGDSWKYTVPVLDKFKEVIWLSFVMGAISFVLQLIIAIPLGVVAATKQYSRADCQKRHIKHGKRNIAGHHRLIRGIADTRDCKQCFCDQRTGKQSRQGTADNCNEGNQGIAERMVINNLFLGKSLCTRSTDIIRI